jgi:hypothetical protein
MTGLQQATASAQDIAFNASGFYGAERISFCCADFATTAIFETS